MTTWSNLFDRKKNIFSVDHGNSLFCHLKMTVKEGQSAISVYYARIGKTASVFCYKLVLKGEAIKIYVI